MQDAFAATRIERFATLFAHDGAARAPAQRCAIAIAIAIALLSPMFALPARAEDSALRTFHIRPQSLTSALIRFSKQSDRQVVVASRIVPRYVTAGLSGSMSVEAALRTLLTGSGLTYELQGEHTVRIVAQPGPLESITASSERSAPTQLSIEAAATPLTPLLLEEVFVTARRIEESAQDVPIVVNVFTPEVMTTQDMRTFTELERMMPAVSTCCGRSTVSAFTYIRGVNNAVGYFAEVPTLLNGNALYFDMANVQVLKGPQGTLFGIATNGGAILYEPQQPVQRFEGYAALTGGERNRVTAEGVINLPVSDELWLRVGGISHRADGYVRDVTNGTLLGTEDYWTGRIVMNYRPNERLTNASILNVHSSDRIPEPLGVPYGPEAGINPTGSVAATFDGPALDAWMRRQEGLGRYEIVGNSVIGGPRQRLDQLNFINTTSYQLAPQLKLRNIAGFVQDRNRTITDTDATPFQIFETSFPTELAGPTRQYTDELQLQGTALDNSLAYVVGTFNRWLKQDEPATMYSYSLGVRSGTRSRAEGNTTSVFAEATYALTSLLEGLELTAGYRFTRDSREAAQVRYDAAGNEVSSFEANGAWGRGSYRWGLTFTPLPQMMLYFMNSKGYSAGGFNLIAPPALRKFDPEILDNYELGVKAEWQWWGRPVRTNLSAYYGDWDDMQAQVTSRCDTSTGVVFCQLTRNAATGKIHGVEGEFTLKPTDTLSISGNFAYMRGEYDEFFGSTPTGDCCVDLSRVPFLYIPKWKYSLNARIDLPLEPAFGRLSVSAAYSYTDSIHCCFTLGAPQYWTTSPSMENANLSVNWREVLGWKELSLVATVTNLTQNTNMQGQWGVYETLGQYARAVALPRTWSLQVRYDF
jgi:iron complex outermembrane receptor protein